MTLFLAALSLLLFAEPPAGFTPVVSPFPSCSERELLAPEGGFAHFFRGLDASAIAAIREDVPGAITPIGFSLLPTAETPLEMQEREQLTRLVLNQRRENLRRHARLTANLRTRCLAPLASLSSWPQSFPASCQPDRGGDVYRKHLENLPAQVNAFRIYYALAVSPLDRALGRLWDARAQIEGDGPALTMLTLPGGRAPLNAFEREAAEIFFREKWMRILRDLETEQATLLRQLDTGFNPAVTQSVRRRLSNLREALELAPERALPLALSWSDPAWQSVLARRWGLAKFEFYQTALGILEQSRVVGLVRGADLNVADLDQAYAHMQLNQSSQEARLSGGLDLDEMFRYTLPLDEVLARNPRLCAAATTLFYRNAHANLRKQAALFATFFGSSFLLPAPLVVIGGMAAAMHQMAQADSRVARTWNDLTSSHFAEDANAQASEMVGALDERLNTARAAVLAVAMLKVAGHRRK